MNAAPPENRPITLTPTPDTSGHLPDSLIGDADDDYVPPIEDSTEFSCTPTTFGRRDTLTLEFAAPHGGELTVHTPSDVFFSLVYPPDDPTSRYSILPSDVFRNLNRLKVAADIRLPPQVYGKDTIPENVFSTPGQYVVLMGDTLRSDHTGPPYICKVMFIP